MFLYNGFGMLDFDFVRKRKWKFDHFDFLELTRRARVVEKESRPSNQTGPASDENTVYFRADAEESSSRSRDP